AGAHVVLRMDLEEADGLRFGDDGGEMLGLEAGAGAPGQGGGDHGETFRREKRRRREGAVRWGGCRPQAGAMPCSSMPWPSGVFIDRHVPLGTSLKTFCW